MRNLCDLSIKLQLYYPLFKRDNISFFELKIVLCELQVLPFKHLGLWSSLWRSLRVWKDQDCNWLGPCPKKGSCLVDCKLPSGTWRMDVHQGGCNHYKNWCCALSPYLITYICLFDIIAIVVIVTSHQKWCKSFF